MCVCWNTTKNFVITSTLWLSKQNAAKRYGSSISGVRKAEPAQQPGYVQNISKCAIQRCAAQEVCKRDDQTV